MGKCPRECVNFVYRSILVEKDMQNDGEYWVHLGLFDFFDSQSLLFHIFFFVILMYRYGWETQLAELTFHTLFMVPLTSLNPYPILTPVPIIVVWSMRWFIFRIMIGAGLIKIRSRNDDKWRNFTAMNYFYETMVGVVILC